MIPWIAGPTASGKSDVALAMAEILGAEILSVDSMQVYRGMDLGTAKPSVAEQRRIPHHLIDVADLSEAFDAGKFLRLASIAFVGIRSRGRTPLLCGGSGLYFKAVAEGLSEGPPGDDNLRAELEATPTCVLLAQLEELDAATFQKIDRKNRRRLLRAVEVCRLSGKPLSAQQALWSPRAGRGTVFALDRAGPDLRERIDARVDSMFARGLVEETLRLLDRGLALNRNAVQAVGYREVVEHLNGTRDLAATVELVKRRTWQVARRQKTWLRGQVAATWVPVQAGEEPASIARRILELHPDLNHRALHETCCTRRLDEEPG